MANITGTNGPDTLTGTEGDDSIQALNGNDLVIGSVGVDSIDGGSGTDTIDYSTLPNYIAVGPTDKSGLGIFKYGDLGADKIVNVETIIGNPNQPKNIIFFGPGPFGSVTADLDIDLSRNRLTYTIDGNNSKTITVKNFNDINAGNGNDRLKGNDSDNIISGGNGNNIIIASKGNDVLTAQTIDYSKIGTAINVLTELVYTPGSGRSPFESVTAANIAIEKDGVGKDKAFGINKIIGAINKDNTLNVSSSQDTSVIINLSANLLSGSESSKDPSAAKSLLKTEIVNFTSAVGTNRNDIIIGANKKGKLTGGGGSDVIAGGNKNDILTGSDSTSRGVGEVDTLTGGGGRDQFVLGDASGAYYVGKGKDDFATITDFNLFQDSISLGGFKDYSFASGANGSIELYSGKDVNTRDLIAKIQLAGGISNRSANSRSVMGADANLNAITAKIDILSVASTADA